jgi:hypothetical protein
MRSTAGIHLDQSAKETVIIVHGTWAAPELGKSRWYEPSIAGGRGFVTKLNTAMQERGCAARCWAHCNEGISMFIWSGENDWIARTHAASSLADYVNNLQKEGWRCHIIAHSHGGNVLLEALPQIMTAPASNNRNGKFVTLGTPFMDLMSPILRRAEKQYSILRVISWVAIAYQ